MTTPTRTRPAARSATRQPERGAPAPASTPAHGASRADRPRGRARSAAAVRAYARRAQRVGRGLRGREHTDSAAGRVTFSVMIISLLAVGVAATLWLSTQAIADSYRLEQAKKEATDLAERVAVLQREVTNLDSASELDRRARELGMVPADEPARLVVQPDGTVVVVGTPKKANKPAPSPDAGTTPEPPPGQAPPPQPQAASAPGGG